MSDSPQWCPLSVRRLQVWASGLRSFSPVAISLQALKLEACTCQ